MTKVIFTDYQNLKTLIDGIHSQAELIKNDATAVNSNMSVENSLTTEPAKMDDLLGKLFKDFDKLCEIFSEVKEIVNEKYFTGQDYQIQIND